MRDFAIWLWTFSFLLLVVGCADTNDPLTPSTTATSSRISRGEGVSSVSGDGDEGTVVFNDLLEVPSGDLLNPIPLLLDQWGMKESSNTIWPDEVRDSGYGAPQPSSITDDGGDIVPDAIVDDSSDITPDAVIDDGGNITPDAVIDESDDVAPDAVEDDSDDGLTPDVVGDTSSNEHRSSVDNDSDDDGEIWGEVVD